MSKPLRYHRLGTNGEAIRLLELQPAARLDDRLQCTLRHVRMHEASFSALSYVWGDGSVNTSVIDVNYKSTVGDHIKSPFRRKPKFEYHLRIGRNLTNALKFIRQKTEVVTLWVDAICIDQSNAVEKSSQIPLMKEIYSTAKRVIAWLGPNLGEESGTPARIGTAFKMAKDLWALSENLTHSQTRAREKDWLESCFTISNAVPTSASSSAMRDGTLERDTLENLSDDEAVKWHASDVAKTYRASFAASLREAVGTNDLFQRSLSSVTDLSRLGWWSRAWILQEVGRASDMVFHYGHWQLPQRHVFLAMSLANHLQGSFHEGQIRTGPQIFDTRFLNLLAARITCMENKSIQDVLELAYWDTPPLHVASDPRDLVYARLGLASRQEDIVADYTLPVSEVYTETSKFLLSNGFMAPLLTFKPYKFMQAVPAIDLPSWVYDCRSKGHDLFASTKFNASMGSRQVVNFEDRQGAYCQRVMTMVGINVGFIKEAGRKFHSLVNEAGLTQEVIGRRTLRRESQAITLEVKQDITTRIVRASKSLNLRNTESDIQILFREQAFPLASFWCWWLHWISELSRLTRIGQTQVSDTDHANSPVELLFREAPEIFGKTINLSALADWQRWSRLILRDDTHPSNGRANHITPSGLELVDSLFRSAWGMRPVLLDTGRLGYVPEDAKPQDQVVIFHGVKAPIVIRKVTEDTHNIIGPAHICGLMQGQLMPSRPSSYTYKLI